MMVGICKSSITQLCNSASSPYTVFVFTTCTARFANVTLSLGIQEPNKQNIHCSTLINILKT